MKTSTLFIIGLFACIIILGPTLLTGIGNFGSSISKWIEQGFGGGDFGGATGGAFKVYYSDGTSETFRPTDAMSVLSFLEMTIVDTSGKTVSKVDCITTVKVEHTNLDVMSYWIDVTNFRTELVQSTDRGASIIKAWTGTKSDGKNEGWTSGTWKDITCATFTASDLETALKNNSKSFGRYSLSFKSDVTVTLTCYTEQYQKTGSGHGSWTFDYTDGADGGADGAFTSLEIKVKTGPL